MIAIISCHGESQKKKKKKRKKLGVYRQHILATIRFTWWDRLIEYQTTKWNQLATKYSEHKVTEKHECTGGMNERE